MSTSLPSLPWTDWAPTRASIHQLLQLMGHVRLSGDPRQAALDFLESTFRGVATSPGWDLEALAVPPVSAW